MKELDEQALDDMAKAAEYSQVEQVRATGALSALGDVPVRLSVEVGSCSLKLSQLLELAEGSVVELDRQAHEPLDIMANGTLIARGEVVAVNGRFGVRILEVVNTGMGAGRLERRQ